MSLLPKSIHRCRRYPTKFNSGRDIPEATWSEATPDGRWCAYDYEDLVKRDKLSLDLL